MVFKTMYIHIHVRTDGRTDTDPGRIKSKWEQGKRVGDMLHTQ